MKQSYINRIKLLEETRSPDLAEPFIIIGEGEPIPDHGRCIQFISIDCSKPERDNQRKNT